MILSNSMYSTKSFMTSIRQALIPWKNKRGLYLQRQTWISIKEFTARVSVKLPRKSRWKGQKREFTEKSFLGQAEGEGSIKDILNRSKEANRNNITESKGTLEKGVNRVKGYNLMNTAY